MGIVNARIDARLIHGQVAAVWTNSLNTQRIIVANDEAAADQVLKASLRMAAPSTVRLSTIPVTSAAENINNGKYGDQRIFLIFKELKDALKFVKAGGEISTITVGNISHKEGSMKLQKSVSINTKEIDVVKKLIELGVKVVVQTVPADDAKDINELL